MLDTFTPEQKASILAQIMKEESSGASLRECCRAQGITLQTFLDWKASARRHNQFDTLHLNGIHPERKPSRFRHEKPKTALQIALETAQRRSYPEDNPEDVAAVRAMERGEPVPTATPPDMPPETPPAAPPPAVDVPIAAAPPEAASEPENPPPPQIEPSYPIYDAVRGMLEQQPEPDKEPVNSIIKDEVITVPKSENVIKPRGIAATMHNAMPWLAAVERKTEKAMGPKPASKAPGYYAWIAHRKELMTPEQKAEIETYFGVNRRGARATKPDAPTARRAPKPAQVEEQREMVAARVTNGPRKVPASPRVNELVNQHAELSAQIADHQQLGLVRAHAPREHGGLVTENERLKRALTALTMENLQLRGLL
jgi:hypothetical protein